MKLGIIGAASNIAGKAYLPVYAALQDQHDFVLYSRDISKAESIRSRYQFAKATDQLANLELCDAVFIHAATSQHFRLAKRFLEKQISVFMDKPISENFDEATALVQLAAETHTPFMVGFNRRFLPQMDRLKEIPHKNLVQVTKNLANHAGDKQFQLYDIFIHPLDTLIYLLDDEIETYEGTIRCDGEGRLTQALVMLSTATMVGLASMNLQAGAFQEEFTVESPTGTYRLSELTDLVKYDGIERISYGGNAWQPTTSKRGFDAMVASFLSAISGQASDTRQQNILLSHQIIAEMLQNGSK